MNMYESSWYSVHLHTRHSLLSAEYDLILVGLVLPIMDRFRGGCSVPPFFVRYGEGGSHIRLRISLGKTVRFDDVHSEVEAYVNEWNFVQDTPFSVIARLCAYTPEQKRYGGAKLIQFAENFFGHSSVAVQNSLKGLAGRAYSDRLGKALLYAVAFALAASDDTRTATGVLWRALQGEISLSRQFRSVAAPTLESDWAAINNSVLVQHIGAFTDSLRAGGSGCSEFADYYRAALRWRRSALDELNRDDGRSSRNLSNGVVEPTQGEVLHTIAASLMHMTNNRLGIDRRDEGFIYHLGYQLLCDVDRSRIATLA